MSNDYYNASSAPVAQSRGSSATVRAEYAAIAAGFSKLPTVVQQWGGNGNYAVAGGSADAWTASIAATYLTSYVDGMQIRVKFPAANTSTTPTINLNGLGAKQITTDGGAALQAADIPAGSICTLTYDGTAGKFQLTATAAANASALAAAASAVSAAAAAALSAAAVASAVSTLNAASWHRAKYNPITTPGPYTLNAGAAIVAVKAVYANGVLQDDADYSVNLLTGILTNTGINLSGITRLDIYWI